MPIWRLARWSDWPVSGAPSSNSRLAGTGCRSGPMMTLSSALIRGLGLGVIADEEQPAGREETAAEAGQRQIGLGLDLGAVERRLRRVGEAGAELAAAGEEGGRLDRIVDLLVEAGERQALAGREIIFVARLEVEQGRIGQERIAGELAVGFEILVDLRRELAELRAGRWSWTRAGEAACRAGRSRSSSPPAASRCWRSGSARAGRRSAGRSGSPSS